MRSERGEIKIQRKRKKERERHIERKRERERLERGERKITVREGGRGRERGRFTSSDFGWSLPVVTAILPSLCFA